MNFLSEENITAFISFKHGAYSNIPTKGNKKYILTEVAYPIVVNGKEFKDATAPILNYEGSTYVPLVKLGDLTGVIYKWNDAAKRVEIDTGTKGTPSGNNSLLLDTKTVSDNKNIVRLNTA
ncbi:stalk domain-containing protein [Paenibacillus tyrfis]|uniref:stalk domain-containing protein n=1 Tax=Paenibacillus tyrfis TaxID=1501230 RepID=UPI000B590421|nr:stalk domain-containing protein [Paenibacillus tyrfis]